MLIQILQSFEGEPSFEESSKAMVKVLDSISKKMINDQNESFALKVFYLSYLIQQSHDHGIQSLIKRWDIFLVSVMFQVWLCFSDCFTVTVMATLSRWICSSDSV